VHSQLGLEIHPEQPVSSGIDDEEAPQVADDMSRTDAHIDPSERPLPLRVIHLQRALAYADHAYPAPVARGRYTAGLHRRVEHPYLPPPLDYGNGVSQLIAHPDSPASPGGVVGEAAHAGEPEAPARKAHLYERVGALRRHEHRPPRAGELEVAGGLGQPDAPPHASAPPVH